MEFLRGRGRRRRRRRPDLLPVTHYSAKVIVAWQCGNSASPLLLSSPFLASAPLLCEKKGKTEEAKQGAQIGCASENCLMHTRFLPLPLAGRP